jgi:sulfite exporter TauE/SafE
VVGLHGVVRVLAYNTGRIGSYGIAGALAGGIAGGAQSLTGITVLQIGGYWLANLMLVLLGLYLMDVWRGLTRLEAAGQMVWQRIRPLMQYLLPLDSPLKALALGGVWGWLPCGMVYSVLVTAMLSGSAGSGALVMLAFGLGTLPTLLTMGLFGAQFKGWAQRRPVRVTGGLLVLGFGVLGLVRAAHGLPMAWLDGVCVSPLVTAGGL